MGQTNTKRSKTPSVTIDKIEDQKTGRVSRPKEKNVGGVGAGGPPKIIISRSPNRIIIPISRYYPRAVYDTLSFYKIANGSRWTGKQNKDEIINCFITPRPPIGDTINGYAFTSKGLKPGEGFVIKIIQSDEPTLPTPQLGLGFTSCDPKSLGSKFFRFPPQNPKDLLKRSEYWVINPKGICGCNNGDEFCIIFETSGKIQIGRNGGQLRTAMFADVSTPLWAFLSLSGSIIGVRLLGKLNYGELCPELKTHPCARIRDEKSHVVTFSQCQSQNSDSSFNSRGNSKVNKNGRSPAVQSSRGNSNSKSKLKSRGHVSLNPMESNFISIVKN